MSLQENPTFFEFRGKLQFLGPKECFYVFFAVFQIIQKDSML